MTTLEIDAWDRFAAIALQEWDWKGSTYATVAAEAAELADLLLAERRERTRPSPAVVCLCGSTRFYEEFQLANYRETMDGRIVLSVGHSPHSPRLAHGEQVGCTPEQKVRLDELHLRKIDMADEVLILNVGDYVGESTARELAHARKRGKVIRFLEPHQEAPS